MGRLAKRVSHRWITGIGEDNPRSNGSNTFCLAGKHIYHAISKSQLCCKKRYDRSFWIYTTGTCTETVAESRGSFILLSWTPMITMTTTRWNARLAVRGAIQRRFLDHVPGVLSTEPNFTDRSKAVSKTVTVVLNSAYFSDIFFRGSFVFFFFGESPDRTVHVTARWRWSAENPLNHLRGRWWIRPTRNHLPSTTASKTSCSSRVREEKRRNRVDLWGFISDRELRRLLTAKAR